MSRKPSTSRQQVGKAAQQIVAEHLSLVFSRLKKAAKASIDKPEPVHRLRVATRRAKAALELFAPVLPAKHADWFLKKLRKLRKTADQARNLDVFALRMQQTPGDAPGDVAALIAQERKRAHQPLIKVHKKLAKPSQWQRHQRNLVAKIGTAAVAQPSATQTMKVFALQAITPTIQEFLAALGMKDRSAAQLHRLRVAGKKLRYSLELVEPWLPKRMAKSVLSQLESLQEVLGNLNDYATASELVDDLADAADKRNVKRWLKGQRKRERVAFSEARAKFLRTWTVKERQKWHTWFARVLPKTSKASL